MKENQLKQLVKETVKETLKELSDPNPLKDNKKLLYGKWKFKESGSTKYWDGQEGEKKYTLKASQYKSSKKYGILLQVYPSGRDYSISLGSPENVIKKLKTKFGIDANPNKHFNWIN